MHSKAPLAAPRPRYSERLAKLLDKVVSQRKIEAQACDNLTVYDAKEIPDISVSVYLANWVRHIRTSEEVFCMVGVYIDRLTSSLGLRITPRNVHRILLSCLVVAIKWHSEHLLTNTEYARVGGVSATELLRLESAYLMHTNWDAHVNPDEFQKYAEELSR
eukprot:TRINITY_DN47751_c0_g1_i1.p1 TRINITY_DN47751_c0_g1~~TRINITY_DN47751_c0_g1_i1.p1  ORF type:complete len:182 (+),score=17.82 TRINITY_DN47751_c0_g1_i1:64-546(+)